MPGNLKTPQAGMVPLLGIKSLPELVNKLQPYFASSSTFPVPASKGTSGGRTVAITNRAGQTPPIYAAVIALVSGTLTWQFPNPFNSTPVVFGFPINSGAGVLYAPSPGPSRTGVVITSSSGTDARFVMLVAIGNPN